MLPVDSSLARQRARFDSSLASPRARFDKSSRRTLLGMLAVLALAGAGVLMSACKVEPDAAEPNRAEVLQQLSSNVIVGTYGDIAAQAEALAAATSSLRINANADTLKAAQAAYRTARATQKSSEAFFYGPADDIAVTGGGIDSWPGDSKQIEALIATTAPVTPADVARLGANQRGFPGLEVLLFDSAVTDAEVLARLTTAVSGARRLELSESMARDLATVTKRVSDAFSGPTGYGNQLATAGAGSTEFPTQSLGIDKLVTGLVYCVELIEMKKLSKPLGIDNTKTTNTVSPEFEEGPRSDSTLADLQADLAGIRAIYTGTSGARVGKGLGDAVREVNPGADSRFLVALDAASAAINGIPAPFRTTLLTNPAAITSATTAVTALGDSIRTDIAGALGASIGFGFSDSD